jgi:glycosyltransferase involved in cell wall biosynthesis
MKKIKIIALFNGQNRVNLINEIKEHASPDTSFFGCNHLLEHEDIKVVFLNIEKTKKSLLGNFFYKLSLVLKIKEFDFVISSANIDLLLIKSLLKFTKTKWLILNIDLINILRKNQKNKFKHFLILHTLKMADRILCLSSHQKKFLASCGINGNVLQIVAFGTDKKFYQPTLENDDYILSVGKDNGRDFSTLLDVAKKIDKKFIIITSKKNLKKLKNAPKNIRVHYDINYQELKIFYEKALCIVIALKKDESTDGSDCSGQTVTLDAMACAKPVIISKREWTADYIEDSKNGLLFKPSNSNNLEKIIRKITENADFAQKIGLNGRKSVENKFNSQLLGETIYNIVKSF